MNTIGQKFTIISLLVSALLLAATASASAAVYSPPFIPGGPPVAVKTPVFSCQASPLAAPGTDVPKSVFKFKIIGQASSHTVEAGKIKYLFRSTEKRRGVSHSFRIYRPRSKTTLYRARDLRADGNWQNQSGEQTFLPRRTVLGFQAKFGSARSGGIACQGRFIL